MLSLFKTFKVPMKWNFSPLFYPRKLRSMLHWFIIFEFKLWSGAKNNFSIPPKLANSSQNVRHSARGQNMQSFCRLLLNSGNPLQWRCLRDLVVVLWSLHTNRNKLKGSEDLNWNNIGFASLWFLCDFSGTHDFGWWFLADLLSGHMSTTILMRKCDSNIGKFVSTELL